jgi:hypothetical protein
MVRKTGLPIRKRFIKQNEYHSIFIVTIDIVFEEEQTEALNPQVMFETLYFEQLHADILLADKGDMRKVCTDQLRQIIDKQFRIDGKIDVKNEDWISVMDEMMINSNKHGKRINDTIPEFIGIQLCPYEKGVSCGNFIHHAEEPEGTKSTSRKDLSKNEIRQILKTPELDSERFKGRGFSKIIAKAQSPLKFNFVENYFEHLYFLNTVYLV